MTFYEDFLLIMIAMSYLLHAFFGLKEFYDDYYNKENCK